MPAPSRSHTSGAPLRGALVIQSAKGYIVSDYRNSTPEQESRDARIFIVILIIGIVGVMLGLGHSDPCSDVDARFCPATTEQQ